MTSVFSILEEIFLKILVSKIAIFDSVLSFFWQLHRCLSQNWDSDRHFEVLNGSKFWFVQKLWHKTQIFPFLFFLDFVQKHKLASFCFFVLCHNIAKWPSESQFYERYTNSWQKMAQYGCKMAIYQWLFFGSLPNSHTASGPIWGYNFWTNQDLDPLSISKSMSQPQNCDR